MEQWKRIVMDGVEYDYEVSTNSDVRNVKTGRIMTQFKKAHGYVFVALWRNGKQKHFSVHQLVATMFIPNPHGYTEVDHIDMDKSNNCVENLRWVSRKENMSYLTKRVLCVETGRIYDSVLQASVETGIHKTGIANCCRGKRKTTGGFHWEYVD